MSTEEINSEEPKAPEEQPKKEMTDDERYKLFINRLHNNIHNSLNGNGELKTGFILFIFPIDEPAYQATIVSNCEHKVSFPLIRKYASRILGKERKRKFN